MGLDNIPLQYPCRTQGTAVMKVDRIDCKATQQAGGCPWQNANPPTEGQVLGIMGTDCWYRGKYGNALLEELGVEEGYHFFGDNEDQSEKSPESCIDLANVIDEALDLGGFEDDDWNNGLVYASWYLRWAAAECGGLNCWY